jgi:hypothetical protein
VVKAVTIDDADIEALQEEWYNRGIGINLVDIDSPFREIARPVIDYVRRVRRDMPRGVVRVYISEYVVDHCWENLLYNQSALRLKSRILFELGKHEAPCPEPRETVS